MAARTPSSAPASERARLQASLRRLLEAGQREGSVRRDVDTRDIVMFGAMLVALPSGISGWDATARRQKSVYLDGLAARQPTVLEPCC